MFGADGALEADLARAVVVGGGLAGCAAAIALAAAGRQVTLVEKRATLGGRAASFQPPGWDEPVDNSQHILLGCCTNLAQLYERLGVADRIHWHDGFDLVGADGRRGWFTACRLPAPAHLTPGLLAIPGLTAYDRLMLAATFGRMMLAGRCYPTLDDRSFADWLGPTATSQAVRTFWRLMIVSVLNADAGRVSASAGLMFFLEGLMRHRDGWRLGVPAVSLSALHHEAMLRYLLSLGVDVRLGSRASLEAADGTVRSAVIDGRAEACDEAVCAVQQTGAAKVVPALAPRLRQTAGRLRTEAIVGIHLRFAVPVTDRPVSGLLAHDVDWIFASRGGRQLSLVASDAGSWRGMGREAMVARGLAAVRGVLGPLPEPELTAACCEQRATFVPLPGAVLARPGQATELDGLALAGEWTATGWPSTMEGAVRSGYRAAAALSGASLEASDLPAEGVMNWCLAS